MSDIVTGNCTIVPKIAEVIDKSFEIAVQNNGGYAVYFTVMHNEEEIGDIGVDFYGGELRVHLWDENNLNDPFTTIKLANL